jgi:hypothetical protein
MLADMTSAVHASPSAHGRPGGPARGTLARVVLAVTVVAAMTLPASVGASPADTAATHAYVLAEYALAQAYLSDASAARAHTTALVESLGKECHGVLAREPSEEAPEEETPTPRARGELQRSERQRTTIQQELSRALDAAAYQPQLAAVEAYGAQIAALHWSDPRIASLVGRYADYLKERATLPAPNVCADMKAWAGSGYHVLSPASRAFEAAEAARLESVTSLASSLSLLRSLLKPYEGPAERALARRANALRVRYAEEAARALKLDSRLQRALGVPENPLEAREHEPVLGRANTPAGARFIVRAEHTSNSGTSCRGSVWIESIAPAKKGSGSFLQETSGESLCLSAHREGASVACGEQIEEISVAVAPAVRTVRLELSDGHAISSQVILIPSRYGGPGGVYVQALRIATPYPVSLTELDRNGTIVHVVKSEELPRCRRASAPKGPKFIDLARGSTPSGEPFTVEGVFVRFPGNHTDFSVEVSAGSVRSRAEQEQTGTIGGHKPKAFEWSLAEECPPHPYAIIYGILSAPGDSVLARTPEGLVALSKLEVAAHFQSKGPLVYGAFSSVPSELIVRRSDGSTLYTQSLTARAREGVEFCEGYAER